MYDIVIIWDYCFHNSNECFPHRMATHLFTGRPLKATLKWSRYWCSLTPTWILRIMWVQNHLTSTIIYNKLIWKCLLLIENFHCHTRQWKCGILEEAQINVRQSRPWTYTDGTILLSIGYSAILHSSCISTSGMDFLITAMVYSLEVSSGSLSHIKASPKLASHTSLYIITR